LAVTEADIRKYLTGLLCFDRVNAGESLSDVASDMEKNSIVYTYDVMTIKKYYFTTNKKIEQCQLVWVY
jgi:glutathionyl-hydroquinone reductase